MSPKQNDIRARASAGRAARWATAIIRPSLVLITFLLNGDFHPDLTPGGEGSGVQQYIGVLLWLVVIAATTFLPPRHRVEAGFGLYANLAFYAFVMLSVAWSHDFGASLQKSVVMLIVLFGAWRLTLRFPWQELLDCIQHGLFLICGASTLLAIFLPDIGLQHDYFHNGHWGGLFVSKQTLGFCSDLLLFISTFRLMNARRNVYSWIALALSALCLIASGSRGSAALAVSALLTSVLIRRWRGLAYGLAFAPFVLTLAATLLIGYLLHTQNRYIVVFGANLDFTERTFIWQHALSFFWRSPWLGFGVNGFWTQREVKDLFIERYQWFLDNYHNGYITILMETGIVGYALFLLAYFCFALRMVEIMRVGALPERQTTFIMTSTLLLFIIDFTETYFMRSTNMRTTMLAMMIALTYSRPLLSEPSPLAAMPRLRPRPLRRRLRPAHEWM